ncbi:tight junction-associated protein 1-like [Babylonia areolata]|uniref:tight junction-associated protein 1-like n=1 Tax=Babylonia areolata TaxID=304850 RepID=UPI003FD05DF8
MAVPIRERVHRRSGSETSLMATTCKDCGCVCHKDAVISSNLDLHEQIEALHSQLQRSQQSLGQVELELMEGRQLMDLELTKTREELVRLRERYDRLMDSHKKMQKLNNNLEDKLLRLVSSTEAEKAALQGQVDDLTTRLQDTRVYVTELEEENEKYRSDCNMAVQMLQCKPSSFVGQRLTALPVELQERVRKHMTREQQMLSQKAEEERLVRVPIPTFPPTAMVFSVDPRHNAGNGGGPPHSNNGTAELKETVPMSLIARVLTQGPSKRNPMRTYLCVNCHSDTVVADKGTQANLLVEHSIVVDRFPSSSNGVHHHGTSAKLYRTDSTDMAS